MNLKAATRVDRRNGKLHTLLGKWGYLRDSDNVYYNASNIYDVVIIVIVIVIIPIEYLLIPSLFFLFVMIGPSEIESGIC
jgi:hypothetical protein